ncbi:hypothetical protein BGZ47_005577 [Haplosporangium gracile]|nr:hypothetical protein BGZ47_005577 [Haplosporangium gracile]
MRADHDEYANININNNNASKQRHTPQDTLATGVTNRLSFTSINDYNPLGTSASTSTASTTTTAPATMATPLVATVPPENYTPLTLKSVRAAKSRNKLRQESQIGVATASTSGLVHMPIIMPRPILKDTSARDKMRESWMSEVPGITISGTTSTGGSNRLVVSSGVAPYSQGSASPSPVAPPKSLARTNSAGAKRQSKMNRHSATEHDQDALTPRPRQGSSGYGPDYRPRRQSGGPGHLLFTFDVSATSSADFESEEYEDSEIEDRDELYSKHLQKQYTRLQQSQLRQSSIDGGSALSAAVMAAGSRLPNNNNGGEENIPYLAKRGQRKSLGDELDVPPVPEKSMQRKRVSTMGATTLPVMSTSLVSALSAANNSLSSEASETLSSITRSNTTGHQKLKGPYGGGAISGGGTIGGGGGGGSISGNSLSFEPLFALKDSGSDSNNRRVGGNGSKLLLQGGEQSGGALGSRLSEVSDADWYTALLTIDPNQQGVSIMDLSKRGLTEVPSGLPSTITHLRLAYNLVQILTPITSLTALHHLQVLDLCDNQLEILPPELGLLTRLKELYLSNNKLYKLPDTIQRMARLEVLDVRNNQFYLLNPVVGRLKALRQLDVRHNQLKSLPPLLHMLSSTLTLLLVDGNQFVQPFSDLLLPLMSDDTESQASTSVRQSYLGDDPYSDSGNSSGRKVSTEGMYEPWRRSVAPAQPRRGNNGGVPVLAKRRSHGDLMTLMGLQKRDGNVSTDDLLNSAAVLDYNNSNNKTNNISTSSGAYIATSIGTDDAVTAITRRERSVSTSNLTPVTEIHSVITLPSASNSSSTHPLSFSKMFKSIRKSSKPSLKENNNAAASISVRINDPKRYSFGSEVDLSVGDLESEASHPQESESKPNSRGSNHGVSRRATSGGINKWVKDRFHKRTNSNELGGLQANNVSMTSLHSNNGGTLDLSEGQQPVRDSGYGAVGGSSTPEPGVSTRIIGNRHQNRSTGHLPLGSPFTSRDGTHQLSSSFDPSQRRERDYRYSYMSIESQVTQATENDSEAMDLDALSQQQHRLSSVHSPTTPLPSSPIMGLSSNQTAGPSNNWNASTPRYGQSAAHIKPLMQYLKDLHDLDPDSSEWEEVYAWRRVWNAERAAPAGLGGSNANTPSSSQANKDLDETTTDEALEQEQQDQLAKSEEIRLAKLQAQASRRRRIVEEIITTERTYVEGLKGLVEIYLTPALQIMPPGDHKAVFSNAQAIYTFHANHFLPELEKAFKISQSEAAAASAQQSNKDNLAMQMMSPVSPFPTSSSQFLSAPSTPSSAASSSAALVLDSGSKQTSDISAISSQQQGETTNRDSQALSELSTTAPTTPASVATTAIKVAVEDRIGRAFAEHVAYMKMYSFYINNFDNALRVLQTQLTQAKHKKKMKEFLRRCAKHPNHTQLALQGYLLLPVQRIPRYKLLLQDLLENTWVDHVDYQDIATALEKISTRADEMNERKRQYENHEKVLLVQSRIIGQYKTPLVQPHRKVVREGMLHLIRVITRNVSMMGLDNKSSSSLLATAAAAATPAAAAPSVSMGDMTVHHLSEETVEKSFLFILFNDIMIQCNPVTGKSVSGSLGGNLAGMNGSSVTLGSSAGASFSNGGGSTHGGVSGAGGSGAGGDGANAVTKDLELQRVLQLESRLHPAEVIGNDVLRVVDDAMVLYLTGDKDVIQAWKEDINSRW